MSETTAETRVPATKIVTRVPNGRLTAFEADVVALFVDLAGALSLPKSYGEIYGLLYASARPLSFAEIQGALELSKGSVSQGLRTLRNIGAIRPAEGPDWRREHFVAETELRQLVRGFLSDSIENRLRQGRVRLDALVSRHGTKLAESEAESRLLAGRLDKLRQWHRKAALMLPLLSNLVRR